MFEGFSEATLVFFASLRYNNNREFFEENRQVYEDAVRGPLVALAEALAPAVRDIDPKLDMSPRRAVSRINRDLRFRTDKTPYKEYMWLGFRRPGESREETCGFYFDLSDRGSSWGCGYYHMQPDTMRNLRERLIREPRRVRGIVEDKALLERFEIRGDAYVRQHQPPEGMPASLGALYRKKTVYAEHSIQRMEELFDPALPERIAADYRLLAPFYELMRECMTKRIEGENL